MTKTVKEIVAEIKETLDKKGGLKHVYFVACGGSKAAIFRDFTCFRARQRPSVPPPTPAMSSFMRLPRSWTTAAWL